MLFADAAALAAEPELAEPTRKALRAIAAHLGDLIECAQADGGVDPGADPQAAAWLLLSMRSAHRVRAAVTPAGLEPAVAALALRALAPPAAGASGRGHTPQGAPGSPGVGLPKAHTRRSRDLDSPA